MSKGERALPMFQGFQNRLKLSRQFSAFSGEIVDFSSLAIQLSDGQYCTH